MNLFGEEVATKKWGAELGSIQQTKFVSEGSSEGWEDLTNLSRHDTPLESCAGSMKWQRPAPCSRSQVIEEGVWTDAEETLIIVDWDDTLCPTSHICVDPLLNYDEVAPCFRRTTSDLADAAGEPGLGGSSEEEAALETMRRQLEQHASAVAAFLRLASSVGHVVIVTLAKREWVEDSIRHFLPGLEGLFEELDIEVVHARSTARPWSRRLGVSEGQDYGQILKTQTFAWVARHFYGTGRGGRPARSWKNVLSIGDSEVERLAAQDVVFRRVQTEECRCKTVKLMDEPSLKLLSCQLESLTSWLAVIARHDGDMDIDIGEAIGDVDAGFL